MRLGCRRCWTHDGTFTPAEMIADPFGRPYEARCAACNESMADAQQEADFAAYHGGALITPAERMTNAYEVKRGLR